MRVVVDENIPYGREAFAEFGEVLTKPGRNLTSEDLAGAEALMVRSITKVNEALLAGTPVRFVATATIGVDHVDEAWLSAQGIGFSSAPGCNANSVAEYITAALFVLAQRHSLQLDALSIGIVGVGNVGSKVALKANALGMRVVLHDPPLAARSGDAKYRPLEEVLACDVVTFHVPLERGGDHPTYHLADTALLARMKPGAFLFNTSRGAVVDNVALSAALDNGHLRGAVLDVWEGEPRVNARLLKQVEIATPHIAGYSFDGKVKGTVQIYEAACAHFGRKASWDPAPLLPAPECPSLTLVPGGIDEVARCVHAVYDILADDARMREILTLDDVARGPYFDRLRKEYPRRREFHNTTVYPAGTEAATVDTLRGLGFQIAAQTHAD